SPMRGGGQDDAGCAESVIALSAPLLGFAFVVPPRSRPSVGVARPVVFSPAGFEGRAAFGKVGGIRRLVRIGSGRTLPGTFVGDALGFWTSSEFSFVLALFHCSVAHALACAR